MARLTPWRRDREIGAASGLSRLRSDMERVFDRFFEPSSWNGGESWLGGEWMPAIDIKDKATEITVCAELPGLKPEDIQISVCGDSVCLSGQRQEEKTDEGEGYYTRERRQGSFCRTIDLPPGADTDRVTADYKDGELTVHIPKSPASQPRKIAINTPGRESTRIQPQRSGDAARREDKPAMAQR